MSKPTPAVQSIDKHNPKGSLWNRWDLHFHTPSSFDYQDKSVSNQQIVDALVAEGIRVVAITDHHTIDVARVRQLQKLGQDKLTVLPGIELRSDQGGDPIHYICIFSDGCDLDHVWTTFQGTLGLTTAAVAAKGGDEKIYVPIEDAARATRELGGVISIHAGGKSNSIEGIKNREQFQRRIKYDITKNYVDIMEIGQIKDIDIHLNTIFPAIKLDRPVVICSDSHNAKNYSIKAPLWFKADPTFRGLLMVLREPRGRVYIGSRPSEHIRIEQNPTKYVEKISFQRKSTAPAGEQWFGGDISFNPGLVAIIGNKGSGKSALSDTLGLLGASKNADSFSFLSKQRFRHPTGGFAAHFDATIQWKSGEFVSRCLSDSLKPEDVERLKYLPQDHVEKVCNELTGIGEKGFEQELKAVIFSHVPEVSRLGQKTLDDLVRFQTDEKQKRIDALLKQLREVSRSRSILESQIDPSVRRELQEKIKRRELEVEAHTKAKPTEKKNPTEAAGSAPIDPNLLKDLLAAEGAKKTVEEQIVQAQENLKLAERRLAVAKRLIEKIDNFSKEYTVFLKSLAEDATELGLDSNKLVSVAVEKKAVEKIRIDATATIIANSNELDKTSDKGLIKSQATCVAALLELQTKLDAPNRDYQAYLKELNDWQVKLNGLQGAENESESLKGMQTLLSGLAGLPKQIDISKAEQVKLALEILAEKIKQAKVYRKLYEPVQQFIDSHALAKDKLKLEFRAELTNEGFADRFLGLLALNRRGSFMGVEDGHARVEELLQTVAFEDPKATQAFLEAIDDALHFDRREKEPTPVQIKDQLARTKKLEEVFDLLYGLEYVSPRYILRWEGKDISMLSPGERGTLLLVFYLLIDKGDMPLIIDQPEGNLDNHTVAKVLVDCIREARGRRQVFIVTHNPNLAVVCDADQVVYAHMDKVGGSKITYTGGSLENPNTSVHVTDVLEGTRWAFGIRGEKYEVGK